MQFTVTLPTVRTVLRSAARRGASPAGWAGAAALCMALVLATAWSIVAGGLIQGTGATVGVALAAVVEAALLARAGFPRALFVVLGPLLAFAAVEPLTRASMPFGYDASLRELVGHYATAMFFPRGIFAPDDWTYTVAVATAIWTAGYVVTWMAVREQRGGLAIFPAFFVLAINAINAPNPSALLLPNTVAAAAALAVVAQTNLGSMVTSWRRRRVAVMPGLGPRYVRSAALAVVMVILFSLLIPPLTSADLSATVTNFWHSQGQHGAVPGKGTAPVAFSPTASPGGPLSADNPRPMLRYTTSASGILYLSLINNSVFRDGEWLPGHADGVAQPGGRLTRQTDATALGAVTQEVSVNIQSLNDDATSAQLVTDGLKSLAPWIGQPTAISAPGTLVGTPGGANPMTVDQYWLRDPLSAGVSINVTSRVQAATAVQLEQATSRNYPAAIRTAYLDGFKDDDRGDVTNAARLFSGNAGSPYQIATNIELALRDPANFTYTLNPPATPDGVWPVAYFLRNATNGKNTTGQGYCQYFASAMGAMLRAEGIPTRLVNGYGPGKLADANGNQITYEVTSNDAHTWVEAYIVGYGWVSFEPTPASSLGAYPQLPRGNTSLPVPPTPTPTGGATPTPTPTTKPTPTAAPPVVNEVPAGPPIPGAVVGGFLLLLALATALTAVGLWLRRPRDLVALWHRLAFLGKVLGVHRRPGDTDIVFANRVIAALPADTTTLMHPQGDGAAGPRPVKRTVAEALIEIAELSGRASFSLHPLDHKESVHWLRCWQRILAALPRLAWRSWLNRGTATAADTTTL